MGLEKPYNGAWQEIESVNKDATINISADSEYILFQHQPESVPPKQGILYD